jgi:hypothetical protein
MAEIQPVPKCPACGKPVDPAALACPSCGHELSSAKGGDADVTERPRRRRRPDDDDDYDIPRARRSITRDPTEEALSWIVPIRESLWAIAAGYMGLFACFPMIGILPAVLGIVLGIVALRDIKRNPGRRGSFRAWFGIVLGSLMLLIWLPLAILLLVEWIRNPPGKGGR